MIRATVADIGRRVVYDARPAIKHLSRGRLVGVGDRFLEVLFDGDDAPLKVISNLRWADAPGGGGSKAC